MYKLFIITAVLVATNALACNVNSSELESVATAFRKQIVQKTSVPTEIVIKSRIPYILVDDENTKVISSSTAFENLLGTFNDEKLGEVKSQFDAFKGNCLNIVSLINDSKEKASVYLILKATYDAVVKTLKRRVFMQTIIDKTRQNKPFQNTTVRVTSDLFDDHD